MITFVFPQNTLHLQEYNSIIDLREKLQFRVDFERMTVGLSDISSPKSDHTCMQNAEREDARRNWATAERENNLPWAPPRLITNISHKHNFKQNIIHNQSTSFPAVVCVFDSFHSIIRPIKLAGIQKSFQISSVAISKMRLYSGDPFW